MRKSINITGLIFVFLLLSTNHTLLAQDKMSKHPHKGFWLQLNEEQRTEIHNKVKEMICEDKTHEEISETIKEKMEGYGVQLPEDWKFHPRFKRGRFLKRIGKDLSDDQRKSIREKIKEMSCSDIPGEEIHEAVKQMLQDFGIHGRRSLKKIMKDLTGGQREEVRALIKEKREQGASREDIREAVKKKINEFIAE